MGHEALLGHTCNLPSLPCAEAKQRWDCSIWMLRRLQLRSLHPVLHVSLTRVSGLQRCQGVGRCVEGRKEDYMYALAKPHGPCRGSSGSDMHKQIKTET